MNIEKAVTSIPHQKINEPAIADDDLSYQTEIVQMLNNKINSFVNDYLAMEQANYMQPMKNYFSENELRYIIEN